MKLNAEDIIKQLKLVPLEIEGGYFRETYRSSHLVEVKNPGNKIEKKSLCTAIYYLITRRNFSHLHMLMHDEIFHFYLGDPVELLLLYEDGTYEIKTLGPDIMKGQNLQLTVAGKTWQGAMLKKGGEFALLGTNVAPGFDYKDYFSAKDFYSDISSKFPDCLDIIKKYI